MGCDESAQEGCTACAFLTNWQCRTLRYFPHNQYGVTKTRQRAARLYDRQINTKSDARSRCPFLGFFCSAKASLSPEGDFKSINSWGKK